MESLILQASLTLQDTRSIHDSMNLPKNEFIFKCIMSVIKNDMTTPSIALYHVNVTS